MIKESNTVLNQVHSYKTKDVTLMPTYAVEIIELAVLCFTIYFIFFRFKKNFSKGKKHLQEEN